MLTTSTPGKGQTGTGTPAKIVTGPQGVKMIVVQTPQQTGINQQGQTVILQSSGQGGQQTSQPFTLQLPSSLLQTSGNKTNFKYEI